MGTHSIRLVLRSGQKIELRLDKVPHRLCRVNIDPETGSDDNIIVRLSLEGRRKPRDQKGHVDDPVDQTTAPENIGEGYGNVVRVGNQTGLNINSLLNHQPLQTGNFDLANLTQPVTGVQS